MADAGKEIHTPKVFINMGIQTTKMPFSFASLKGNSNRPRLQPDLIKQMTPSEARKAKSGDVYALQRHRYDQYYHWYYSYLDESPQLLDVEQELREVVQEEIAIKQGTDSSSEKAKEKLRVLNVRYHVLKQRWLFYQTSLHKGYLARAFDLWRSHPRWYMHKVLVEDCASREGCCARSCGCCLNRNIDQTRKLGVGHCTLRCGCCQRARGGLAIPEEDQSLLRKEFSCKMRTNRSRWHNQVSIWGLVNNSTRNPFDMIQAPPSSGQI